MANQQRRMNSIPSIRLTRPLPSLPITLDDIHPRNIPQITITPYHDVPATDQLRSPKSPDGLPPCYEPMYDYLRSHQQQPGNLLCPPSPQRIRIMRTNPEPEQVYQDEPFVITIEHDLSQPPPPSYEELYIEDRNRREWEMLAMVDEDMEGPSAEEICKFVLGMLMFALTVACVGTAFYWGGLGCSRC